MKFSKQLIKWLNSQTPKTLSSLGDAFREKSFAVAFLLLMALAALPLPTGGVTHVFEVITILLGFELVIGRRSIWLPRRWRKMQIGKTIQTKALPKFISFIRFFERFSRPRFGKLLAHQYFSRLAGVLIILFTISALLAPPLSGLDTLPAMGVILISLSILLEDVVIFVFAIIAGSSGIMIELLLGSFVLRIFH